MTTIYQQLQDIGLTPNQSTVYLALFKMGEAKAGELIKKTGFHRNLIYVALQELQDKKLIASSKKKGIFVYKTLSPSRLLGDIQEKEKAAKNVIEELDLLSRKSNNQEIIIYEGIDEFRRHALRSYSIAKNGSTVRYLGTSPHWHDVVGPSLEKELGDLQKEKKLYLRGIAKASFPAIKEYLKGTKGLTEVKTNPLISSDANNIEILEDRICIQSFVEPYSVIEIINEELAKNYQNYFDFLWKQKSSKPI